LIQIVNHEKLRESIFASSYQSGAPG
jgi:hypothetical protein